jgi:hypothetical protein
MENINELELRRLLKDKPKADALTTALVKRILDESLPWEEKRSCWHLLYLSGREGTLAHALTQCLKAKLRVPFDLLIQLCTQQAIKPTPIAIESLIKGLRKQGALDELIGSPGWDRWDKRLRQMRTQLLERKIAEQKRFKDGLLEKFEFLQSQRMTEQAGRVLRRMVELYPEDPHFAELKSRFDEQWAREVLANHMASSQAQIERTQTAPSTSDQEMLNCFLREGEKICVEHREFAADLAIGFWWMENYTLALEILAWAPPTVGHDWMKAELLYAARRFIEALEHLNTLEIKYIDDPETTFAVSYMRARCLRSCGQEAAAQEILQSIVRVRPNYRSAHALLLEWTEGAGRE